MKKTLKKIVYSVLALITVVFFAALILAYIPLKPKSNHVGISPDQAVQMREQFTEPHQVFTTTDGETLFMRRWNPEIADPQKQDIAVLIFHGITAHSGPYKMMGEPFSKAGYTTFGLDYRGHGLSGGNRADYPSKERRIADLVEAVHFVKGLGFARVVVLGHSLGVASAIYVGKAIPDEIAGLILLSGAYEGKNRKAAQLSLFEKAKILSTSIFRPSVQVVEYFREGMTGLDDPLFNFKYTLRFLTILDMQELHLPQDLNIPVLVGVGDKDELFDVEKVRALYDQVPGDKKEFVLLKDAYHAKFPAESWQELIAWLDKNF